VSNANGEVDSDIMDFSDFVRAQVDVYIGDKKYNLRQASGVAAAAYKNLVFQCVGVSEDIAEVKGPLADAAIVLVAGCLYNQKGGLVGQHIIQDLPDEIVQKLFQKAKELSKLGEFEEDEESAKNAQPATTDGSA